MMIGLQILNFNKGYAVSFESLKFLFKCLKTNRPELTADFHMSSPLTAETFAELNFIMYCR